jgi:hypothetical protein
MLVYLHGFNSSPQSRKATFLKERLAERGLADRYACPALPHWPLRAIEIIEAELARHAKADITLLGSSLGGFYATWLAEQHGLRAVLINPAVYPHRDLRQFIGPQRNLYTGEEYELTEEHARQLESLWVDRIDPLRYLLLVETGDEVLDYREAVARYRGALQRVIEGGDHTLVSFPALIPEILAFAGMDAGR